MTAAIVAWTLYILGGLFAYSVLVYQEEPEDLRTPGYQPVLFLFIAAWPLVAVFCIALVAILMRARRNGDSA